MDFDQTQAIQISFDESETGDDDTSKTPVSHLKLLKYKEFSEKEYPLYEGDNIIGRAETCDICIPTKALSKQHACIEVKSGSHLVYDKKSLNKTRRGKLFLQPEVRYELKDGDKLIFADVECIYHISLSTTTNESGSETGSESMLNDLINNNNQTDKEGKNETAFAPTLYEEDYADDSDASSDILQPTQCYQPTQKILKGTCSAFFVADSDDESLNIGKDKNTSLSVTETPLPRSRRTKNLDVSDYVIAESGSEADDEGKDPQEEDNENDERILAESTQKCIAESDDDETDNEVDKELLNAPTQMFPRASANDEENEDSTVDLNAPTQVVPDAEDGDTTDGVGPTVPYDMDISDTKTPSSSNLSLSPIPKLGDSKRKFIESVTTDTDADVSHVTETQSFSVEDNLDSTSKRRSSVSLKESCYLDEVIQEEEDMKEKNEEVDMSHLLMPTLACDMVDDVLEEDEPEFSGRNIHKETEDVSSQVLVEGETQIVGDTVNTDKEMTAETQLMSDTSPGKSSASVRKSSGRRENSVDATVPIDKATQLLEEDENTTQPLSEANDETQPIGLNLDIAQPLDKHKDGIKAKREINKDATLGVDDTIPVGLDDPTMKIDEKDMASSEESTQVYETATTTLVVEADATVAVCDSVDADAATVPVDDPYDEETSVGNAQVSSRNNKHKKNVPDNDETLPVETLAKDKKIPKRPGRGRKKNLATPIAEDATIPLEEISEVTDSEKASTKNKIERKKGPETTVHSHSGPQNDSTQPFDESTMKTHAKVKDSTTTPNKAIQASVPMNSEQDTERAHSHGASPVKSDTKNMDTITRATRRRGRNPLPSDEDLEPTQAYGVSPIKSGTKSDDSISSEISPLKLDCTIEATQPYEEGQDQQSSTSTVPLEATQSYSDGLPLSDTHLTNERLIDTVPDATGNEEDSEGDTLPVEDIEFVPDSESLEEDKPPLIPIPSRSPHKPTLVSPKNSPRNRSSSPSPKRVVFVGLKDQTPPEDDDEMSPVIDCQDTTESKKPTATASASAAKGRTRGRRSGANVTDATSSGITSEITHQSDEMNPLIHCQDTTESKNSRGTTSESASRGRTRGRRSGVNVTDTTASSITSDISHIDSEVEAVEKRVSKRGRGRIPKASKDENETEGNAVALFYNKNEESQEKSKAETSNNRSSKGKIKGVSASKEDKDSKVVDNEPKVTKAKTTRKSRGKLSDVGTFQDKKQTLPTEVKLTRKGQGLGVDKILSESDADADSAQVVDTLASPILDLKSPVEAAVETTVDEPVKKSGRSRRGKNVKATSSDQPELDLPQLDRDLSVENLTTTSASKETITKQTRRGRLSEPPKKFQDFEDITEKIKRTKNIGKGRVSEVQLSNIVSEEHVEHPSESMPRPKGSRSKILKMKDATKSSEEVQENENTSRRRGRRSIPAKAENSEVGKDLTSNLIAAISKDEDTKDSMNSDKSDSSEKLVLTTLSEIAPRRGRTTSKRSRNDSAEDTSTERTKRSRPSENEPQEKSAKEEKKVVKELPEIAESPRSRRQSNKNNSQELEKTCATMQKGKQVAKKKSKKTGKEEGEVTGDSVTDSEPSISDTPKGHKRRSQEDGSRERDLSVSARKVSKRDDSIATPSRVKMDQEPVSSPTLRKKEPKPRVMFTGVVDEQGKKIVKELGGTLAESIQECSHLVTDKIRRTVKLLGGLCLGLQIVNPQWLEQSKKSGMFLDSSRYIVTDKAAEKQYKFKLSHSISIAAGHPLLQGYKIHVTKSVKPDPDTMKEILECAGAEFIKTMPKKKEDGMIVISCDEDKKSCDSALAENIDVVSSEFILTGILRQKVDIESFRLFRESSTSSKTAGKSKGKKR